MRNIIIALILGMVITSCGSTTEIESEEPAVSEGIPKNEKSYTPQRKSGNDAEKIAEQIGLSKSRSEEFVTMWNSTESKLRQVRKEYMNDDKQVLISKMQEVKDERDAGLRSILTDAELTRFYKIMVNNRPKLPPVIKRKDGN